MLLSGFGSPRRLVFLALALFVVAIIFLPRTSYSEYLPKYDIPGLSSTKGSERKSSLEEDVQQPAHLQRPTEDELGASTPAIGYGSGDSTSTAFAENTSEAGDDAWRIDATTASSVAQPTPEPPSIHNTDTSLDSTANASTGHGSSFYQSYQSIQLRVQELIKGWKPPPIPVHWPPYDEYRNQTYDPNRWEGFQWDNDFYINNGIKQLQKENPDVKPEPYLPYPAYNTPEWRKKWKGTYVPCEGARGKLLNESDADLVRSFPVVPEGFPAAAVGQADVTGINMIQCFDRYNRYGPYGYGQDKTGYVDSWQPPANTVEWESVRWGELQNQCLRANQDRYPRRARHNVNLQPGPEKPLVADMLLKADEQGHKSRTAVLIRTWEGYDYAENDLQAIRALITELSLLSGGEYQVFLFVNVKDWAKDFFHDSRIYQEILDDNVPKEFHDITILWNESIFETWYPKIGDWQVYWHQFLPLLWFAKTHPEFDYTWNWETDARYTGNHYEFLEGVANFSKNFPRKHMWERNQRFYFPAAHGSYEDWLADTDAEIETGMREHTISPVWGPQPYVPAGQEPIGPTPPTSMKEDQFTWGVGEEADLITLQPIWDPTHTSWSYKNKIWNYIPDLTPTFTAEDPLDEPFFHPDFPNIPRRTYINTLSRFSRRQLHAMHLENLAGRAMQAEMWPATVALQHGLKAVYAPHPIWTDRKWPPWYMDAVFNAALGKPAQWGQQVDSVYNHDREHNFVGWSWHYQTEYPKALYRRWLGWPNEDGSPLSHVGGPIFEITGVVVDLPESKIKGAVEVGGKGRMCLPPMLLHPVKNVRESGMGHETWESYAGGDD